MGLSNFEKSCHYTPPDSKNGVGVGTTSRYCGAPAYTHQFQGHPADQRQFHAICLSEPVAFPQNMPDSNVEQGGTTSLVLFKQQVVTVLARSGGQRRWSTTLDQVTAGAAPGLGS